jgi:tagaturonate epimerase
MELPIYSQSVVEKDGTTYAMLRRDEKGDRHLLVSGDSSGFEGETQGDDVLVCPLTPANAEALRARLPWLVPVAHGLKTSAGFGDRLGIATPGHAQSADGTGVAAIYAQQSVRENDRTGRTPREVMDDAMWGVFQYGWQQPWGGDADHLKVTEAVDPFVEAGFTFYTIDPSDHVDDDAETADMDSLRAKVDALPWDRLDSSVEALRQTFLSGPFEMDGLTLTFDEHSLYKAAAKYGAALAHTADMARYISDKLGDRPFDLEMSVDETGTTTSAHEHFYIASELRRLGVKFVSLAPRFVGRFEKGVDYIGDLDKLDANIAQHAAIMRHFGSSYKLSLHTGSDKFGVYPIAMKHTSGLVHLKTAGTSYLEALRVMANVDTDFFRQVLDFARERYETDRVSYHVSAVLDKVPAAADLTDDQLPDLLNQFDARQVLHVTFGSVLDRYGDRLHAMLRQYEDDYQAALKKHFDRHIQPLAVK